MRRECGRHRVRKTGDLEHGRVGGPHRRRRFKRCRPMLLEDYPRARWRDIRLGERHCDAALDPTAFADRHLRGRAKGDLVASGLHIDAMKPHARIGHRGAVHLERGLQSSRKREKLGHLPLLRGIPAHVEPDGMKRDDQHPADKRGAIIHVPVSVWLREGYGKLFRHPTAVRRGVGGFRVAQHLHRPVTHDEQAETAGRERDDALIGERTERFWDGLIRRRVVLLSTAVELCVAVDRDDASDAT